MASLGTLPHRVRCAEIFTQQWAVITSEPRAGHSAYTNLLLARVFITFSVKVGRYFMEDIDSG